jgi:hypothetical protein
LAARGRAMVEQVAINVLDFISIQRPRSKLFRFENIMKSSSHAEISELVQTLLLNQNYCANVRIVLYRSAATYVFASNVITASFVSKK